MTYEKIDEIYKSCDQYGYSLYISSLYGLYKEYIVGVDKKVKLDYSKEVPMVIINNDYPASKYTLKYGDTHDLSNTIFKSSSKLKKLLAIELPFSSNSKAMLPFLSANIAI